MYWFGPNERLWKYSLPSGYCRIICLCVWLSGKLTSASKEALASHTSPNSSPNSIHGSRRGSISSVSSVSSVLDEKDDDRIRCCRHCKDTVLKREQQIDEREFTPDIVKFYEVNETYYLLKVHVEDCMEVYVSNAHHLVPALFSLIWLLLSLDHSLFTSLEKWNTGCWFLSAS